MGFLLYSQVDGGIMYLPNRKAAEYLGLHPNTLREYADNGRILYIRTPSGRRRYNVEAYLRGQPTPTVACYCRGSSIKQKDDLQRQVDWIWAQYPDAEIIQDIGGGLNWKQKRLVTLPERLHGGDELQIVVADRDRLARFGFEVLQWFAEANGREIVVLGNTDRSPEQELTEDILAILHTPYCRLHGLRRYSQAIKEAKTLSHTGAEDDSRVVA